MKPPSVWIGKHAVDQFYERIEKGRVADLTQGDRWRIEHILRDLYRVSVTFNEYQHKYLAAYRHNGQLLHIMLVIAPDDTHPSGGMKLVTVYQLSERRL